MTLYSIALFFHIDKGSYDTTPLDGLNVAVIGHAPGPMGAGNWTIAAYIDERADDQQTAALGAIFGGAEGGPMAAFAPLIGTHLALPDPDLPHTGHAGHFVDHHGQLAVLVSL